MTPWKAGWDIEKGASRGAHREACPNSFIFMVQPQEIKVLKGELVK